MALVLKKDLFTPSKKQPVYYSDIDAWFTPSYGLRDVGVYENVDAVKNSIRNIVLTNRGERFFNKEDRKSTRLNSSHPSRSRMPSSA